jgi:hypothetical protein
LFYRIRNTSKKWWFNQRCKAIFDTRPVRSEKKGLSVVSMVRHDDLTMYLLAVKSFLARLGFGEAVVINDGSLTPADEALLREHISPLRIVHISSVPLGACPSGGTWERLVHIVDLSENDYVVQLDSDTLTLEDPAEVRAAIGGNRSFILGTASGIAVEPIAKTVELMQNSPSNHVQAVVERSFDQLPGYPNLLYCRGCSGFAGFAKGGFSRGALEGFSKSVQSVVREKWKEWGSEQVSSNFLLSNSPGSGVLPYPQYSDFGPKKDISACRFLHFIGTYRWDEGEYIRQGRRLIGELAVSPNGRLVPA